MIIIIIPLAPRKEWREKKRKRYLSLSLSLSLSPFMTRGNKSRNVTAPLPLLLQKEALKIKIRNVKSCCCCGGRGAELSCKMVVSRPTVNFRKARKDLRRYQSFCFAILKIISREWGLLFTIGHEEVACYAEGPNFFFFAEGQQLQQQVADTNFETFFWQIKKRRRRNDDRMFSENGNVTTLQ